MSESGGIRAMLFDVDGTILVTGGAGVRPGGVPSRRSTGRARAIGCYLKHLPGTIRESNGYRLMPGIEALLDRLIDAGVLLGLVTGSVEAAAHVKLSRAGLKPPPTSSRARRRRGGRRVATRPLLDGRAGAAGADYVIATVQSYSRYRAGPSGGGVSSTFGNNR